MPCSQQVKVTYDKDKRPIKYELLCSGQCDDDKKDCKRKEEEKIVDKKHVTREFCACNEGKADEPLTCHIVLYTVRKKKGEKVIEQYFKCEVDDKNKCPDGQKCAPWVVGTKRFDDDPEKTEANFFECQCVPEDKVWREK